MLCITIEEGIYHSAFIKHPINVSQKCSHILAFICILQYMYFSPHVSTYLLL
jgi:hypothetical protein